MPRGWLRRKKRQHSWVAPYYSQKGGPLLFNKCEKSRNWNMESAINCICDTFWFFLCSQTIPMTMLRHYKPNLGTKYFRGKCVFVRGSCPHHDYHWRYQMTYHWSPLTFRKHENLKNEWPPPRTWMNNHKRTLENLKREKETWKHTCGK